MPLTFALEKISSTSFSIAVSDLPPGTTQLDLQISNFIDWNGYFNTRPVEDFPLVLDESEFDSAYYGTYSVMVCALDENGDNLECAEDYQEVILRPPPPKTVVTNAPEGYESVEGLYDLAGVEVEHFSYFNGTALISIDEDGTGTWRLAMAGVPVAHSTDVPDFPYDATWVSDVGGDPPTFTAEGGGEEDPEEPTYPPDDVDDLAAALAEQQRVLAAIQNEIGLQNAISDCISSIQKKMQELANAANGNLRGAPSFPAIQALLDEQQTRLAASQAALAALNEQAVIIQNTINQYIAEQQTS